MNVTFRSRGHGYLSYGYGNGRPVYNQILIIIRAPIAVTIAGVTISAALISYSLALDS